MFSASAFFHFLRSIFLFFLVLNPENLNECTLFDKNYPWTCVLGNHLNLSAFTSYGIASRLQIHGTDLSS